MAKFNDLPLEVIYRITQLLCPRQLAKTRMASKMMQYICDRPALWKHIQLKPQGYPNSRWNKNDIKSILKPHVEVIEKIDIWDVCDDILRHLLLNCPQLKELTVYGWTTLSDHAFLLPQQINLRRLRLIGERKTNFTSLDSIAFSQFIQHCPQLEEVSIVHCHIQLHAESFIKTLYCYHPLKYLSLATKQTWSTEQVLKLFQLCSNLSILALVPDSKEIMPGSDIPTQEIVEDWTMLQKDYQFIQEQEMNKFNNVILFRSNKKII